MICVELAVGKVGGVDALDYALIYMELCDKFINVQVTDNIRSNTGGGSKFSVDRRATVTAEATHAGTSDCRNDSPGHLTDAVIARVRN